MSRRLMLTGAAVLISLSLGACRDNAERAQLATQDDGLTSNDPAVKGAIEDQIMVDPSLASRSNAAAATVGAQPVTGGVPPPVLVARRRMPPMMSAAPLAR